MKKMKLREFWDSRDKELASFGKIFGLFGKKCTFFEKNEKKCC